ncbi:hypothetical protein JUNP543_1130 [Acinetobacter baumannii]|uniref:hypothetical protein n=1 Tax=Acinetobacter baumannii TaxID=470 RepID=UPI00067234DA|nr:hypothetical protein [Acinetobacter baumannii]KMV03220.1 hypothetical protein AB994_1963 [Acinetobacter baumannii]KMV09163.1 hypothetical protein AB994_3881 [Acinetobacter baumannii]HBI8952474.1 hypothetical protein [Acinetobacter baumannii]HBI8953982.1 hypothetical protein [Acinetobacter baumannii]HBI8996836.1 hypothetical protein [Acinetobacter baumannii]
MTDLNKERELFELFELNKRPYATPASLFERFDSNELGEDEKHYVGKYVDSYMQEKWELWQKAKAQAVTEHIITLQRNGEVFKFDLLDLLRRSLKSSKVLKTRENWSHVSKMVGIGSTTATLLCKEMNVDPEGTVFVASESGAEG